MSFQTLYIAEKPSLGRAIADVLPKPLTRKDGYILSGDQICVSWCIGHLLEQAEPEDYDPAYKKWQAQDLPIIPSEWQLKPKSQTRKQLTVLKKLMAKASVVVHAGDPDREGQLLVDEVIHYVLGGQTQGLRIQRCLISDLNPPAVRRSLASLQDNQQFIPLSTSALARARADWLYGINMTRIYTLQGQKVGYQGVLSVGRVQTPVLGLVVRRDQEIEAFVSKPFYEVLAELETQSGEMFRAKWSPSEACQPYMDEAGRVLSKPLAENVVRRISGQPGVVEKVESKPRKTEPPLPYNLSALQIDAAKRYGLNAQRVLDSCQALYEKHKLITYPRSDCRYLPEGHHAAAGSVAAAVASNMPVFQAVVDNARFDLKNKAWNDRKVEAHHAIIPTAKKTSSTSLSETEVKIYGLVCRHYLLQFYPAYRYQDTRAEIRISGGLFIASAQTPIAMGWKDVADCLDAKQARDLSDKKAHLADTTTLPPLKPDQSLHCQRGVLLEKQTQPPAHFTDATLLAAMTGISRFVKAIEIRKILKETDGLGTEATRAGIIELLFKRGFLKREGKKILATPVGRGLIASLPAQATLPDMTAHWEAQLNEISQRSLKYDQFMGPLQVSLAELIGQAVQHLPESLRGVSGPKQTSRWNKRRTSATGRKAKSRRNAQTQT
ncbi:MAG: DNA topoisomerase III [Pseudomonadales bacterium]|nr:DNA topoisomerase III [Pseudomonadales bacterium]